jgi:hypothetical protein
MSFWKRDRFKKSFKAGDIICRRNCIPVQWLKITAIGETRFLYMDVDGIERVAHMEPEAFEKQIDVIVDVRGQLEHY